MPMSSTDSEQLFWKLMKEKKSDPLFLSMEDAADTDTSLTANIVELVLRLKEKKECKEDLKRKLLEHKIIVKAMSAAMKQPEMCTG